MQSFLVLTSDYLGMEVPREYDAWKKTVISGIVGASTETAPERMRIMLRVCQRTLANHIDRLWYDATLEVISSADVYNPGGKRKIPRLYTIDAPYEQRLGELKEHEAFRLFRRTYNVIMHDGNVLTKVKCDEQHAFSLPTNTHVFEVATKVQRLLCQLDAGELFEPLDTFEILQRGRGSSVVRSSGGYVTTMSHSVLVGRVSDLARAPNGYSESKVALASFPVAHVVSHRTLWVNRVPGRMGEDCFITAFVGDAQASVSDCNGILSSGMLSTCILQITSYFVPQ